MINIEKIILDSEVLPNDDIVFKYLFGSLESEKKGILKGFLESILGIKIDSLTLTLPTELNPDFADGKKTRVDVRARLLDGTNINVEMQTTKKGYSDKRCLQHWSKIYSDDLKKSLDYSKLNKTICIWILNEDVFDDFEDYQSEWKIIDKEHNIENRFDSFEIHIIELKKFRKCVKIPSNNKEMWLCFIDHTNREMVKMACDSNEKIEEAFEQLDKARADEKLREILRLREAYECDETTAINNARSEGEKIGREAGEKIGRENVAKNMKALGIEIEKIAEATGLSKEEIEKL